VDNGGVGGDAEDAASAARLRLGNRVLGPGRFGRMFRGLGRFRPPDQALIQLGQAMTADIPEDPAQNNSDIPAGFTYLGQFIDHDITRDETEGFPRINDPDLIEQGRSVTLDLDSLYGLGPRRQPGLYNPNFRPGRARFRLGPTTPVTIGGPNFSEPRQFLNDLPRRPDEKRTPVVGDDRNDENTIVAQTHVAFLKFHNKVMNAMTAGDDDDDDDESATFTQAEEDRRNTQFHRAKRRVRWHYQWLVLNDFLNQLVDPDVLADIKANGRRFYDFEGAPFDGEPFMPLEFSVAAYRFGHSMVRDEYNFNRVFSNPLQVPGASFVADLGLLFTFTGKGGLGGDPTLPSNWVIDWRRFFPVSDPALLNFTRKIDPTLAAGLNALIVDPGDLSVLAVRNLLRGSRLGLPTGQAVAEAMGVTPLTPAQVAPQGNQVVTPVLRQHGFDERTPLWYYILREARLQGGGNRLGEVGSRIVAEVFFGLVEGDPNSFLSKRPDWTPNLPSAVPNDFTMADLLRFVDELNPIG
jgi:Animal haem peroxidase